MQDVTEAQHLTTNRPLDVPFLEEQIFDLDLEESDNILLYKFPFNKKDQD